MRGQRVLYEISEAMRENRCDSSVSNLRRLENNLEYVRNTTTVLSNMPFLKSLLRLDDINATLEEGHRNLADCLVAFQIRSNVNIEKHMEEYESARLEDAHELSQLCSQLVQNEKKLLMHLNIRDEDVPEAMLAMQRELTQSNLLSDQRTLIETGLVALQHSTRYEPPKETPTWAITYYDVDVDPGSELGGGGFGIVTKAQWRGLPVAVKHMKTNNTKALVREVETWIRLRHDHIVPCYGASVSADPPFIVLRYMQHGHLLQYLQAHPEANRVQLVRASAITQAYRSNTALQIFEVSLGLRHLHGERIVHGDIKGVNILVDDAGKACITDFGLAFKVESVRNDDPPQRAAGTLRYMAPELMQTGRRTYATDVYAFGMLIYEVLITSLAALRQTFAQRPPFLLETDQDVQSGRLVLERPGSREIRDRGLTDEMWGLLEMCASKEPVQRPTSKDITSKTAAMKKRWKLRGANSTSGSSGVFHPGTNTPDIGATTRSKRSEGPVDPKVYCTNQQHPPHTQSTPRLPTQKAKIHDVWAQYQLLAGMTASVIHSLNSFSIPYTASAISLTTYETFNADTTPQRLFEPELFNASGASGSFGSDRFSTSHQTVQPMNAILSKCIVQMDGMLPNIHVFKHSFGQLASLSRSFAQQCTQQAEQTANSVLEVKLVEEWLERVCRLMEDNVDSDLLGVLIKAIRTKEDLRRLRFDCPRIIRQHEYTHHLPSWSFRPCWEETMDAYRAVLGASNSAARISGLKDDEALRLVELIDELTCHNGFPGDLRRRSLDFLRDLCGKHHIFPTSCILPYPRFRLLEDHPVAGGGFADVWKGVYQGKEVALKVPRLLGGGEVPHKILEAFCKEAVVWKCLRHFNITTFYGIDTSSKLCLVSEWMSHGSVDAYLKQNPTANRLRLVRANCCNIVYTVPTDYDAFKLADTSAGLAYLHEMGIMHGDLKSMNILVNSLKVACLSDFGLAAFDYDDRSSLFGATTVVANSTRWTAPELLDPEEFGFDHAQLTCATDVYSFGMVMWELFTGHIPFHKLKDAAVIRRVFKKDRPLRPLAASDLGLCDEIWNTMQDCWRHEPTQRPAIESVLTRIFENIDDRSSTQLYTPLEWPLSV
ncbi:hypothetical protein CERSUDRAFT_123937 [Gelatoporia subvermispora B]|uniref:Protein kinase domain-containing protein n=1 Tax=Ceriporiopsis subvermispora (strain B) TaxID=914234 RepID=M2PLJ9_CERS8|nr:hypothetical protein CERSUDRAFT_123937 [Gelatoporia subvermispora B]